MIRRPVASALGAVIAGAVLSVAAAHAQPAAIDPVKAAEQFDLAMKKKRAGDWPGACAAFAASQRFEPAIGTQLNLAECLARDGALLAAAALLRETAATAEARQDPRAQLARDNLRAIEARLPRFDVRGPASGDVRAELDGQLVTELSLPVRVDPGRHHWKVTVAGQVQLDRTYTLAEGAVERIEIHADPVPGLDPDPQPPLPGLPEPPSPSAERRRTPTFVYVIGAGAIVAAGAGTALLVSAHGLQSDAESICPDPDACADPMRAQDYNDRAVRRSQYGMFALGGAGVFAITAGVVWWRTRGSDAPPRAAINASPDGAIVTYGGRF